MAACMETLTVLFTVNDEIDRDPREEILSAIRRAIHEWYEASGPDGVKNRELVWCEPEVV